MSSPSSLASTLSAVGFISCDNAFVLSEEEKALVVRGLLSIAAPTAPDARLADALVIAKRYADFLSDDLPSEVHHPQGSELGDALLVLVAALRASQPGAVSREEAWCQPMDCGKHMPRRFMIYFDDPDHGIMVFDNEAEARAAFERKNTAWNCYLFGALPLSLSIPANGRGAQ